MKQRVVDEDHERFSQIGDLILTEKVAEHLGLYSLKFDDGEVERFLAYQIIGVKDE